MQAGSPSYPLGFGERIPRRMEEKMDIKEIRELTGLNQTDFAKKYNIPLRTYQNWEYGTRKPPEYVLTLLRMVVEMEYSK